MSLPETGYGFTVSAKLFGISVNRIVSNSYNCHKIFIRGHSHLEKPCKIIIIILILSPENRYMTPILTHWIPDRQITLETDASDYAIGAILSITLPDGEIHPVAFHSRTLTEPELNYDTHDKELLTIFEAFTNWHHYLEGSTLPVDVVTDHKNLEYFSTTKLLTRRQARWCEFLSQFNLVIHFRPGKLGTKPDSLTRRWDVYPKEGDRDYAKVNPQNFRPVFTQEQLASSLRASYYFEPLIRAVGIMDVGQLHTDIHSAQQSDTHSLEIIATLSGPDADPRWSLDGTGLLCYDGC